MESVRVNIRYYDALKDVHNSFHIVISLAGGLPASLAASKKGSQDDTLVFVNRLARYIPIIAECHI